MGETPEIPEAPNPEPELTPIEEVRKELRLEESTENPSSLESLGEEVVDERIRTAIDQSTVPPEEAEELAKDAERTGLFEGIALLLAYLVKHGWSFSDETIDFFHTVDDNNESDADQREVRQQRRRALQASRERARTGVEGEGRDEIIESALDLVGSTNFRGPEVDGGNLACAQVVTTALVNAGYMTQPNLSCSQTSRILQEQGWTMHQGPGQPGDVVMWKRTQRTSNYGNVQLGYPHIGIVVGEDRCVSNSSGKRMPRLHSMGETENDGYWYRRGVDYYLSPPTA